MAVSSWLQNVPELSRLTLLSFHVCYAHQRPASFDGAMYNFFGGSLSTHERVYGIVHIKDPKTCKMTGHATQQRVHWECAGICQLIYNIKASTPDHKLDPAIWRFTPAQHFVIFQRQLRNLVVSHQHYTFHGLRRGGATDHWLQYRDLPPLRTQRSVDL